MRKLIAIILFIIINFYLAAQVNEAIQPEWNTSYGMHDHTSRDVLSFMEQDSEGNIILAGQVERDSSFADVVVQKLDINGQFLWSYRYSSDSEVDYDIPLKCFIDSSGSIYLLATLGNNRSAYGSVYLLKLSKDGQLLWLKDFRSFLPEYIYFHYYYAFLDSNEQVKVLYTGKKWEGPVITHFLTFAADGSIVEEFTKNDLLINSYGSESYPVYFYHDKNDHFLVFLQRVFNDEYVGQIRKISKTTDIYIDIPFTSLPNSHFRFISGEFLESDAAGNIYAVDNIGIDDPVAGFQLVKIAPTGKLEYVYNYGGIEATDLSAVERFIAKDSNLIITGRYKPQRNFELPWQTFITQLDSRGNVMYHTLLTAPEGGLVPQGFFQAKGKIHLTVDYQHSGRSSILELNDTLGITNEYALNYKVGHVYDDVNLIYIGGDTLLAGGTISQQKFENASFLSEQDFRLEAYSCMNLKPYWNYEYTDIGTSNVQLSQLYTDGIGNTVVLVSEAVGPECFGCTHAPIKYYLSKYSTTGIQLWTIPLPDYYVDDYNKTIFFDGNNNIYLKCRIDGNFVFTKFSPNGEKLASVIYQTAPIDEVFTDRQNNVYITRAFGFTYYSNNKLIRLGANLEPLQEHVFQGRLLRLFQLPDDAALYYYVFLPGEQGVSNRGDFSLYRNGQLQWTKNVEMSSNNNGGIYQIDYDKTDGTLFVFSSGTSNKILKFTLSGEYNYNDITASVNAVENMVYQKNWNLFVCQKESLKIFDKDLMLKKEIPVTGSEYYIPFLIVGDFCFRIKEDSLQVYDYNGNLLGSFQHPPILPGVWTHHINQDYNLYTVAHIGESLPISGGGSLFGWRWSRGVVAKFQLSKYLDFVVSTLTHPASNEGDFQINVFPNPAQDYIFIENKVLSNIKDKPLLIKIIDASGKQLQESKRSFLNNKISLSIVELPRGLYYLKILYNDTEDMLHQVFAKFVKH